MTAELHVLFGAGQVEHALAKFLLHAGKRVRRGSGRRNSRLGSAALRHLNATGTTGRLNSVKSKEATSSYVTPVFEGRDLNRGRSFDILRKSCPWNEKQPFTTFDEGPFNLIVGARGFEP
jgi:hypothetical protein